MQKTAYEVRISDWSSDVCCSDLKQTPVEVVAVKLERHLIKWVPVLREGKLVGIVSWADLIQELATWQVAPKGGKEDRTIKPTVETALQDASLRSEFVNVVVNDGIVHFWGSGRVRRRQAGAARSRGQHCGQSGRPACRERGWLDG